MEQNLIKKADAFGYLYKEHQKEIKLLIEKRDRDMEATLDYKEKLWSESLDMVNNNKIIFLQVMNLQHFRKTQMCFRSILMPL